MNKTNRSFRVPVFLKWIGWVLLVQLILINISAAFYAWRLTHIYDEVSLRNAKPSRNVFVKTWRLFTGPRQFRSQITLTPTFAFDTVQLKTANGILIDTWYAKADSSTKGTVILFHGVTSNKGMVINEANEFRYLGYDVMLVDFRGHGNSEGKTTTIGIREAEEVKLAYDYAFSKKPVNIFLWGTSMGAVVISKAISEYHFQPSGVILEMPFGSLQAHLRARARALGFHGMPEKPFGFFVSWWIGMERKVKPFKHCTSKYMKEVQTPVLMQWGTNDLYVQRSETEKIFSSIASASKKLVTYEGAGHESLLLHNPVKWRLETEQFLSKNSK